MHEVLVNRLGGLSLPRKSVERLIDRPDMTIDVLPWTYTTTQQLSELTEMLYFHDSQPNNVLKHTCTNIVFKFYYTQFRYRIVMIDDLYILLKIRMIHLP